MPHEVEVTFLNLQFPRPLGPKLYTFVGNDILTLSQFIYSLKKKKNDFSLVVWSFVIKPFGHHIFPIDIKGAFYFFTGCCYCVFPFLPLTPQKGEDVISIMKTSIVGSSS